MKIKSERNIFQAYGAPIALVILLLINCFTTPNFISWSTISNLVTHSATVMILGIGMTMVIATGGINISVGSVMAVSSMVLAKLVFKDHIITGVIVCLLVAVATGVITGIIITVFKVQPMITTLAMMYALRGVAKLLNGGTILNYKNQDFSNFAYVKIAGIIPIHFVIVFVLAAAGFILLRKTRFGLYVEAYGDNPTATKIAGVNTILVVTAAYVLCNVLAGVSGILEAAATTCADPVNMGLNKETDAIAATVVGGTPMAGGRPNVFGTICGALILQLITIMINMNNVPYSYSLVLKALIIVISIYAQNIKK